MDACTTIRGGKTGGIEPDYRPITKRLQRLGEMSWRERGHSSSATLRAAATTLLKQAEVMVRRLVMLILRPASGRTQVTSSFGGAA